MGSPLSLALSPAGRGESCKFMDTRPCWNARGKCVIRNLIFKFRRQHPIDHFIIDFYCAQAKLCIEIDGASHLEPEQEKYDALRTEFLEELGCKVIRFTNNDVRYNIHAVVDEITSTIENLLETSEPAKPA
jgi:very-short-patch-repair endonuclease